MQMYEFNANIRPKQENTNIWSLKHSGVPPNEEQTEVDSYVFTSCGNNVGYLPPTAEDCVTYYESLGGNTTDIDMMDLNTIEKWQSDGNEFPNKSLHWIGLDQAMETPPIGIQKWTAPSTGIFTWVVFTSLFFIFLLVHRWVVWMRPCRNISIERDKFDN